jgi:hypothetical protein
LSGSLWSFFPQQFPLTMRVLFPFSAASLRGIINVSP